MMRSMFSGVSGLRIHQSRMDVIANNLANVNTPGFKASRATFTNVFAQTLSGASGGNVDTGRGGRNPMQVGLGSNLASVDRRMTQGAAMRTDNPMDLMIDGAGFFIYSDDTGTFFGRSAILQRDPGTGWLVNEQGLRINGWNATVGPGQWEIQEGNLGPIVIGPNMQNIGAIVTGEITFAGNLDGFAGNPPSRTFTKRFHDSLGTVWNMNMRATLDTDPASATSGSWILEVADRAFPGTQANNLFEVVFNPATETMEFTGATLAADVPVVWEPVTTLEFDPISGHLSGVGGTAGATAFEIIMEGGANLIPAVSFGTPDGTGDNVHILNFGDLTQFSGRGMNAGLYTFDGNTAGELVDISVGADGMITGVFSNDLIRNLGFIPLAQFQNPAGLEALGNGMFRETSNSGAFDGSGVAAASIGSDILGGALEMSNVDLGNEFTEMIITQRGFQSNSRIIQVSDEMLAELANLRR